jgi:hypothetical protein
MTLPPMGSARALAAPRRPPRSGPAWALSVLSFFHRKSVLYGAFLWVCRALNSPKRRFPTRAEHARRREELAAERRRQVALVEVERASQKFTTKKAEQMTSKLSKQQNQDRLLRHSKQQQRFLEEQVCPPVLTNGLG